MKAFIGILAIALTIIGFLAIMFYLGKKLYAVHTAPVNHEPKKSIPAKQPQVPWSQLSGYGKLGRFAQYVLGYWFLFAMVLMFISGQSIEDISSEQMNNIILAPFVLPFLWIWNLFNNKTFGYFIVGMFVLWMIQKELERLHSKLDEILEALKRR